MCILSCKFDFKMFHFDLDDFIMPDEFVPGEPPQPVPGDNRPNKYRILSKESRTLVVAAVRRGDDAEAIATTFQTSVRQVKKIFSRIDKTHFFAK